MGTGLSLFVAMSGRGKRSRGPRGQVSEVGGYLRVRKSLVKVAQRAGVRELAAELGRQELQRAERAQRAAGAVGEGVGEAFKVYVPAALDPSLPILDLPIEVAANAAKPE